MEKLQQILLLFLAFHFLKAGSQVFDTTGWLSIDCGAEKVQEKQGLEEMNTLRSFHDVLSEEHCYKLPVYKLTLRYIIRAGFFYGNYDGLSRPPTFNLTVEGKMWTTVNTSSMDGSPTREGEAPFISSLEAVPMWVKLFPKLTSSATIHLVTRTNFGGPEVRFTSGLHGDMFNRIWTRGATPPNCREVSTMPADTTLEIENRPPMAAVGDSIEPINPSDP
ncbi:putative leucine-rich repeat receptor-like serine/threonine-protein kinase [Vitis vinifera]|uniref:Putative leucine-rich repeat receptor-like serine/threonine-protein kinase n=1 Tax=Vitis vinifera TaxID=29760 RepID=A0A438ENR9_VITVI|nr:putative leucine-rich repeat receptor-like serine/threonine-protein kinase [Vitis vinifera]